MQVVHLLTTRTPLTGNRIRTRITVRNYSQTQSMMMKAVVVHSPDEMRIEDIPRPVPKPTELLVKIHATALNRADVLQRQGKYPPPPGDSPIMGLEMSGVVEEVGSDCPGTWKKGDRVFGLLGGGGYAQYCTIPAAMAMPIPPNLDWVSAAAIPEAFLTAFQALHWLGYLSEGKRVLIHAGASGVGLAAVQLVKQFPNCQAIVTAGSPQKIDFCRSQGADYGINYKEEKEFSSKLLEVTGKKGVDILLDFVGGPYWNENIKCMGNDSVIVLLGMLGGPKVDSFNMAPLLQKRIHIKGSTLRARSLDYKIRLTNALAEYALPRFADGRLKPNIDCVFDWHDVTQAHAYMEANKNMGKIVMTISD